MKAFEVVRILNKHGWKLVRTNGSHHTFEHKETKESHVFVFHDERREIDPPPLSKVSKDFKIKFKR